MSGAATRNSPGRARLQSGTGAIMRTPSRHSLAVGLAVVIGACTDPSTPTRLLPTEPTAASASASDQALVAMMDQVNAALAAEGAAYRAGIAEYIASDGGNAVGATLLQKDVGNKRLGADFVPFDARRPWSGPSGGPDDDITYAIDMTIDAVPPLGGLTAAQTTAAIRRAMGTWDAVPCSNLPLTENPSFGLDIGLVAFLSTGGAVGGPFVLGDIQHAGWRDGDFPGGILAVTFTFVFVDVGGPTDVDGNGLLDVALREIYYDPSWPWMDGTGIDVETVALHEAGHGLSQAHFGNIFLKKGVLTASPRAVMNAFYGGVQQSLLGTDNGGHCANWANWPNN